MRLSCLELIMEGGRLIFRRELPLVPPKCQEGDYSIEGLGQDQGNTREGRNQPEHLYVITYVPPLVRYQEMVSGNRRKEKHCKSAKLPWHHNIKLSFCSLYFHFGLWPSLALSDSLSLSGFAYKALAWLIRPLLGSERRYCAPALNLGLVKSNFPKMNQFWREKKLVVEGATKIGLTSVWPVVMA